MRKKERERDRIYLIDLLWLSNFFFVAEKKNRAQNRCEQHFKWTHRLFLIIMFIVRVPCVDSSFCFSSTIFHRKLFFHRKINPQFYRIPDGIFVSNVLKYYVLSLDASRPQLVKIFFSPAFGCYPTKFNW